MDTVSIAGLDKAEVLAAAYNASQVQGMGHWNWGHTVNVKMTVEEARAMMDVGDDGTRMFGKQPTLRFDYLKGRPLKLDLTTDDVESWLYDRDNGGPGSFARVIAALREKKAE